LVIVRDWIWRPMKLIRECKKQGIPAFPFVPFLGQMPAIDKALKGGRNGVELMSSEDMVAVLRKCYETYGKVFCFNIGKTVRLSIADPHLIKDILALNVDSYTKPLHIRVLGLLGNGLFASSGNVVWAPQRQLFNPALHNKEVKSKLPTIVDCAHAATERWAMEVISGRTEVDMYQKFLELTLDVIGKSGFGVQIDAGSESSTKVIQSFNQYLYDSRDLVFGLPAVIPAYSYLSQRIMKRIAKERQWLESFMGDIIHNRQRQLRHGHGSNEAAAAPNNLHDDLLDIMIGAAASDSSSNADTVTTAQNTLLGHDSNTNQRAVQDLGSSAQPKEVEEKVPQLTRPKKAITPETSTRLSRDQLMNNAQTFLLAGHETTASLLTWTIYLLAEHPQWQERARAEVEEFCHQGGDQFAQELNRMKTVTMILYESMRLFPPVPLIGRTCIENNTIGANSTTTPTTGKLVIAKGLEIVIPVAMVHRDPGIWGDDADQFQPARFANGISGACGNPFAFIPFGAGPRTCIGQTLALSEARTVLAAMLPMFSWTLAPGFRNILDVTLTLQPKFGMPIVLTRLK
jgi:cytochrome P450